MNHLTIHQILQTVDGTADYATQAVVNSHLAVCPACRKEVEFQRSLLRSARRAPLQPVSDRFTRRVMSRVLPRAQHPLAAWILNNMGSLFGMMAVLGTLWMVLSQPMALSTSSGPTEGNRIVEQWRQSVDDGYSRMSNFIKSAAPAATDKPTDQSAGSGAARLGLVLVSLGVLVLIDRLWLSRHRIRPRN